MVTIKINETSVDLIRYGVVLHTFVAPRQTQNIQAAHNAAEEMFPYDEAEVLENA